MSVKVEIDADDLCQLKTKAEKLDSTEYQLMGVRGDINVLEGKISYRDSLIENLKVEINNLNRTAPHPGAHDFEIEGKVRADLEDEIRRLKKLNWDLASELGLYVKFYNDHVRVIDEAKEMWSASHHGARRLISESEQ